MYSDERGGFIIDTDEDIDRASMVFDSYGRKCNSRFLLNYGFIVDENDANEVAIVVYTNHNDPLI
jgi:histone-lysine N-methyltransferase SETD3